MGVSLIKTFMCCVFFFFFFLQISRFILHSSLACPNETWAAKRPRQRASQTLPTFEAVRKLSISFIPHCDSFAFFTHYSDAKKKKGWRLLVRFLPWCPICARFFAVLTFFFYRIVDQMSHWNAVDHSAWQGSWMQVRGVAMPHIRKNQTQQSMRLCRWRWSERKRAASRGHCCTKRSAPFGKIKDSAFLFSIHPNLKNQN